MVNEQSQISIVMPELEIIIPEENSNFHFFISELKVNLDSSGS